MVRGLQEFKLILGYHWRRGELPNDLVKVLYCEVVGHVINTMLNSFFHCQDILERIAQNKGVDAQVALQEYFKIAIVNIINWYVYIHQCTHVVYAECC